MTFRNIVTLSSAVFFVTAGFAVADVTTVSCEDYLVTLSEEETMAAQSVLGSGAAFDAAVCDVTSDLNVNMYEEPTRVTVTLSDGSEHEVMVQKKGS